MHVVELSARLTRLAVPFFVPLWLAISVDAGTIYVKNGGSGNQSGSDWNNALADLDTALSNASNDDEIWVAASQSNYIPSSGTTGFLVNKRLKIYGGFRGNEGSLAAREGLFTQTILDASGGLHAVSVSQVAASAELVGVVIDGFVITGGAGFTSGVDGGGIHSVESDLQVANCFIRDNNARSGGGMYFRGGPSVSSTNLLQIKACVFSLNIADFFGGGLYAETVYGEAVNASFLENDSELEGGGVYLTKMASTGRVRFTNGVFWSNTANDEGGGMSLGSASGDLGRALLVNCSFNMNDAAGGASSGGGISTAASSTLQATIYNSVFWGDSPVEWSGNSSNYLVEYSTFEVNYPGGSATGNLTANPVFQNPGLGRLRLTAGSPCIDAANADQVPPDVLDVDNDTNLSEQVDIDADGSARFVDDSTMDTGVGQSITYLDMGAYEFH